MKVGFDMRSDCGFFSVYFFLMCAYIYCCETDRRLRLNDQHWKFSWEKGWVDYFEKNDRVLLHDELDDCHLVLRHMKEPDVDYCRPGCRYPLSVYRRHIRQLYQLKPELLERCDAYGMTGDYVSIFVRLGDKLYEESKYYQPSFYVNLLYEKYPNITKVFIHSDDHDEVLKIAEEILSRDDNILVYYITDSSDCGGALVQERLRRLGNITKKSVDQMNPQELKFHTEKMLCAIELMRRSQCLITDYQSNVSRFMKLYFTCPVYSIMGEEDVWLDMDADIPVRNPSYGFSEEDFIVSPNKSTSVELKMFISAKRNQCNRVLFHKYYQVYGTFLENLDHKKGMMLELGADDEYQSVCMWRDVFPRLFVVATSNDMEHHGDHHKIHKMFQANANDMLILKTQLTMPLWLIVDNGTHVPEHQLYSFNTFFPSLQQGGVYVIEAVEVSYWRHGHLYGHETKYGYNHPMSVVRLFRKIAECVNRAFIPSRFEDYGKIHHLDSIASITFAKNCVIITKKEPEEGDNASNYIHRNRLLH